MRLTELVEILNAIPQNSKLKYIYFGPQSGQASCQSDETLEKLTSYVKGTKSPVLVLGLSELHLLATPESTIRLADVDENNQVKQTLLKYHNARAPKVPFDSKPPAVKLPNRAYGSTYH